MGLKEPYGRPDGANLKHQAFPESSGFIQAAMAMTRWLILRRFELAVGIYLAYRLKSELAWKLCLPAPRRACTISIHRPPALPPRIAAPAKACPLQKRIERSRGLPWTQNVLSSTGMFSAAGAGNTTIRTVRYTTAAIATTRAASACAPFSAHAPLRTPPAARRPSRASRRSASGERPLRRLHPARSPGIPSPPQPERGRVGRRR